MSNLVSKQIILHSRPKDMPTHDNFRFVETPVPDLVDGQVLIKNIYISVDPYMRGRMKLRKSYAPPYEIGQVILGESVGEVVQSRSDKFKEGDIVLARSGWQTYAVMNDVDVRRVNPDLAPISTALGILGMPGMTAYFGLLKIGNPQPGETLVVSGAAGAVGSTVGQIGKIKGCRVVGIAGSEEKIRYLTEELGFDAAVNYKSPNFTAELEAACPDGVDIYFDNVGGPVSDAVINLLNYGARIPLCGQIALYNLEQEDIGPRPQPKLLITSTLMKGFIVWDYREHFDEALSQLAEWVNSGQIKYRENIVEGFDNTIDAFLGLFRGDNTGKQLVKVAEPST